MAKKNKSRKDPASKKLSYPKPVVQKSKKQQAIEQNRAGWAAAMTRIGMQRLTNTGPYRNVQRTRKSGF